MKSETEGVLVASTCLIHALIGFLLGNGVLLPKDVADIADSAEEFLAGLKPELMSAGAREHARVVLQQAGTYFRPK